MQLYSKTLSASSKESTVGDFIELTKPSVTLLVVLSCAVGMVMAPLKVHHLVAWIALIATALASGGSAAFNMWYDRDIDALMIRTQNRPIVRAVIQPDDALVFAVALSLIAITLMAGCVSYVSALLLLLSIVFYCLVYTVWLKRLTAQNIVIGGIAGSIPPIIGWFSVSQTFAIEPIILFLLIFFWTPAHFWALAIHRRQEYAACKVPMLPITKGINYTKKSILFYVVATIASSLALCFTNSTGLIYLISATCLAARFLYLAILLYYERITAIKLFLFSIAYLFILFAAIIIDHYVYIAIT